MLDKLQDQNQVKGRWGELLAAFAFPAFWVVRPLPQDYGIDLQVEVFKPDETDATGRRFRSTGGHFSCQVKTTDAVSGDTNHVSFPVNTVDLHLAELMGAASPLVLLHVERPSRAVRYLCLTDYVEKFLNVEQRGWRNQETVTVHIPRRNEIQPEDELTLNAHWQYFAGLALRAKLYAAANQFHYLGGRLNHAVDGFRTRAPHVPEEGADLARDVQRVDAAIRQAIASVEATALSDLRAPDSPYAGMFDNVTNAAETIKRSYLAAHREISLALTVEDGNTADLLAAQRSFELAATQAMVGFATATTVGKIYEETHRLAGLFAKPLEYDIVRSIATSPTATNLN